MVGPHSGKKVQEAKKLIQGDMVDSGEAVLYQEPERTVTTRSGDQCTVALTDQWYVGPSSSHSVLYIRNSFVYEIEYHKRLRGGSDKTVLLRHLYTHWQQP